MKTKALFLALATALVTLPWLACSGSPTSPSAQGVTIQGTLNASSSVASAQSVSRDQGDNQSATCGLTVSVMGTGLSTTSDCSGKFTLSGVPSGTVTLKFSGKGINATLTLSGLVAGQTLSISVKLSGSGAELEPGDDNGNQPSASPTPSPTTSPTPMPSPTVACFGVGDQAQVDGKITAMDSASITVQSQGEGGDAVRRVQGDEGGNHPSSVVCDVSSSTVIRKGNTQLTLSSLQIGNHVHVSGTGLGVSSGVCTINATEIKLQGGD
jgi:hypothetical protein